MKSRFVDWAVPQRLLKVTDFLVLALGALMTGLQSSLNDNPLIPISVAFFALTLAFVCLVLLRAFKLYEPSHLTTAATAGVYSFGIAAVTGFVLQTLVGLTGLALGGSWTEQWLMLCGIYFSVSRVALQIWARPLLRAGRFRRRIAIVGGGKAAEEAIDILENSKGLDVEIVGLFDDRFDNRSPQSIRKHKKLGTIAALADFARGQRIDLIVVAIPMTAEQRLLQILERLWELPVDIRISAASSQLKFSRRSYAYLGDLPLLSVFDRPLSGWNQFLKDTLDKTVALLAIICFSPVMALVALAVKLESRGPVIFKQKRYGFNNELIEVCKFRSMYTDRADASAAKLVTKDDPRVTRVGRFIRKTSLDELPQLFNVLKGTLSLVGPRPHATQAKAAGGLYDQVVEGDFARHKVRPGITGWAQINGWRGETDTIEKITQRVKHDLEYIDQWSLGLDLYILARTPLALLKSENAY
jgi:Undecaprenyl-phosphate glucose phosphotransferase